MLKCLSKGIMKVKLKKLEILQSRIKALGHELSEEGLSVDPGRIKALRLLRKPSNKDELRSFLGSVAYVKSFIPHYSHTTAILSDMLKKNVRFEWNHSHDDAYEICLRALEEGVVLNAPSHRGSYVLVSDASNVGVGSALLQLQEDNLVLISFWSKSLSDAQRKWDTRERELYGIKYAVEKSHHLIVGHHIDVYTDHKSLLWTQDAQQSKVQRWMWFLSQYDITLHHIEGRYNVIADWLSRCIDKDPEAEDTLEKVAVPVFPVLRKHVNIPGIEELQKHYGDIDDGDMKFLYRGPEDLYYDIKHNRLFIPKIFRNAFLFWIHTSRIGGHRGIIVTRRKLSKIAYWPGMHDDVKKYIEGCWLCSRNRDAPKNTAAGILERPNAWEVISVDYVGPRRVGDNMWYYLVVICHSTRYMVTGLTKNPDMKFTIQVLREKWIPYFGYPRMIIADNAFKGELCKFSDDCGIILLHASVFNPKGNGINERSHAVLEKGISSELSAVSAMVNFDDILRDVTYAYNTSFNSAIRETPYYCAFGTNATLPGFQEYTLRTSEDIRMKRLVENKIKTIYRYNKAITDQVEPELFEIGEVVIYFRDSKEIDAQNKSTGIIDLSPKYTPRWSLPAKVIEVSPSTVTVKELFTEHKRRITKSRVKKLRYPEEPELQLLNWVNVMRTIPKRSLNRNKIIIKELEQFFPKVHYQEDLEHLEEGPIMKRSRNEVRD